MHSRESTESKEQVINLRMAIREHRDQIGDYRCWVDDEVLYFKTLPELQGLSPSLPSREAFHERCRLYFENRQAPDEDPNLVIPLDSRIKHLDLAYDTKVLDVDLQSLEAEQLEQEVKTVLTAVRRHKELGYQQRNYQSDRDLYLVLPEKTLAVTKLPPRELFLGRGCPDYNEHCQKNPDDFIQGVWGK